MRSWLTIIKLEIQTEKWKRDKSGQEWRMNPAIFDAPSRQNHVV